MENLRRANKSSLSGLLGAHFDKTKGRWLASITLNYKHKHLGYFATPELAHAAYLKAKRLMHEGCTI